MAIGYGMRVDGLDETRVAFARATRGIDSFRMNQLATEWKAKVRGKLPKDSGHLRDEVGAIVAPNSLTLESRAEYSKYVMFGSKHNPNPTGDVIMDTLNSIDVERYVRMSVDVELRKAGL